MTIKLLSNKHEEVSVRQVRWFKDEKIKESIKTFLQGAVYDWSKNNSDEYFSLSDLMGGKNKDWKDTPLQHLYDYQSKVLNKSKGSAKTVAGQAAGLLLREMLHKDGRTYISKVRRAALYKWDGK